MLVTLLGIAIVPRDVQDSNAHTPIAVNVLSGGNITVARLVEPLKILSGRLGTPTGISMPIRPLLAKAPTPIIVSALSYGKKIPLRAAQSLKASAGIVVIIKGIIRFPSLSTLPQLRAEQLFPLPNVEKGVNVLQILQPLAPAEELPL